MASSPIKHLPIDDLHPSGCARTEGYYKINPSDKSKYLPHLRRSKNTLKDKVNGNILMLY